MYFQVVPSRDRTLHRVLKRSPERRAAAGERLWSPEEGAHACLLVRQGLVAIREPGGRALAVGGPGDLVALEALRPSGPYMTEGEALTEVRVAAADAASVVRALRRGIHTLPLLLGSLQELSFTGRSRSAGAGGPAAATRLAQVVVGLGRRMADADGWLPRGLTHQLLGELAGLHRATVTTRLNDWLYRDWLAQDGRRLRIADRQALERLAHVDRAPGAG